MTEPRQGGCLCGQIRYQVTGPLRPVLNCHCGMCQRFHGHYGAYTSVRRADLAFIGAREPAWFQSSAVARRGFCPDCGSSLFWHRLESSGIEIAAGSLDQPSGLVTGGHIFVADKPDYYEIADSLPQDPGSKFWGED